MAMDPIFEQLTRAMPPLVDAGDTVNQVRYRFAEMVALVMIKPDVGEVRDTEVPGGDGPIRARIYRPDSDGPHPTVVFFHGGGFAMGDLDTHDLPCRQLCNRVDAVVVSVEYRLVPEHPFPAGIEDALAATRWAAANIADLGGDPARLAVAGDSAGGNLSAVVAQQLALEDGGPDLAAQLLIYPATDLSEHWRSRDDIEDAPILIATHSNFSSAHTTRIRRFGPIPGCRLCCTPS